MVRFITFLFLIIFIKTRSIFTGSGIEDINGVFEESNTYQPSVPSSEAEIIVRNKKAYLLHAYLIKSFCLLLSDSARESQKC